MNAVQNIENTEMTNAAETGGTDLMLDVQAMTQIGKVADIMAQGAATIPKHLQGNKGDCFAVAMQAAQWGMNPFAVAQKTHLVSGTLGYEAQLVNAVISSSRAIRGSFHYEWFGEWSRVIGKFKEIKNRDGKPYKVPAWNHADEEGLGIRVFATLAGEEEPRYLELLLTQAQVRNSTLWASDPKQQLAYLAVKRWARLYCPSVIMGVYTPDELHDTSPRIRDVNPAPAANADSNSETLNEVVEDSLSSKAVDFLGAIESSTLLDELSNISQEVSNSIADGSLSDFERTHLIDAYKRRKKQIQSEQI
ncbi:hypothetical protein AMBLS11_12505 [Alteromonas macleodii str. 'Black Sea 11']|nr:hypothetical protein AMBLS11_12505 [Alteromonas macleodii str. 'Black Sea 11']